MTILIGRTRMAQCRLVWPTEMCGYTFLCQWVTMQRIMQSMAYTVYTTPRRTVRRRPTMPKIKTKWIEVPCSCAATDDSISGFAFRAACTIESIVAIPFLFRASFVHLCRFCPCAIYAFLTMVPLSSTFINRRLYYVFASSFFLSFPFIHFGFALGFVAN